MLTEVCLQCQADDFLGFSFLGGGLSLILSSLSLVLAKSVACIDSQSRILDWRRIFLLVIHVSKLFANGRHWWHGIGWPSVLRLLCQVGLLSQFVSGCTEEIFLGKPKVTAMLPENIKNARLRQQRFWICQENKLTNMTPHNKCVLHLHVRLCLS